MFNHLKRHLLIYAIIPLSLLCLNCSKKEDSSNPEIKVTFVKTLGGSQNESAKAITATSDGGYAVLGYAQSNDGDVTNKTNTSFDYWLLKFDQNHTLQWQKTYGGSDDDRGNDLIQTNDGGFVILGSSSSHDGNVSENNGANDFWILKTNASGDLLWQKSLGFLGEDHGISILETNDNGFLLNGVLDVTASEGQGNSKTTAIKHAGGDYWTIKLNNQGETEWSRYYGGTFTDTPYDAIQTQDNGYIIVGSSDSNDVDISDNKGSYDFWVIKISETGTLIWEKSFGGSQIDEARSITRTNDGNFIIVGDTRSSNSDISNNNGAADFWIIKIAPSGELIWEKTFGGTSFDAARSITKTLDGHFIISGSSRSAHGNLASNQGQNDVWLIKINTKGNLIWQKSIGGSDIDLSLDLIELSDQTIIAVGESNSSDGDITTNKGFTDMLIIGVK